MKTQKTLVLLSLVLATAFLVSCDDHVHIRDITDPGDVVVGSGLLVTETRSVPSYDGVWFSGAGDLVIDQGGSSAVTITADDNILPLLSSEVSGGRLSLGTRDNVSLAPSTDILWELVCRELRELQISGAADVEVHDLSTDNLSIQISGVGGINADGRVDLQDISITGSGSYEAADVPSRITRISISGNGTAVVRVRELLEVTITGNGVVEYYGDPEVVTAGGGSVRRRGA